MEAEKSYVYAVYKYGSFTKAAQALYMTQPALSIAVQKIEERLGQPLFDRTTKPLRLTPAGELYMQSYYRILDLENELQQQINDLSSLKTGCLRIGGTHYLNAYVIAPVLTKFMKRYPGIEIQLMEAGSSQLLQMLATHEIDLTFNCAKNPKDSFLRTPVFKDTILLAVPRDFPVSDALRNYALTAEDILQKKHLDSRIPELPITLLRDTPLILLSSGNNLSHRTAQLFDNAGYSPNILLSVTQLVTAWHLACEGLGAAFVSDRLIRSHNDRIAFYKAEALESTRVFDLTMSNRHYVSNAMQEFLHFFQEYYQKDL